MTLRMMLLKNSLARLLTTGSMCVHLPGKASPEEKVNIRTPRLTVAGLAAAILIAPAIAAPTAQAAPNCAQFPWEPTVVSGADIYAGNTANCSGPDLVSVGAQLLRSGTPVTSWNVIAAYNPSSSFVKSPYFYCDGTGTKSYQSRGRYMDSLGNEYYKYGAAYNKVC